MPAAHSHRLWRRRATWRTRREGSTNALVMSRGGSRSFGELRHHRAVGNGSLYMGVGGAHSAGPVMSSKARALGWISVAKERHVTILALYTIERPSEPASRHPLW